MENTTYNNMEKKNTEEAPSVIEHEEFETLINYSNFNMAKNDVWNR